MSRRVAAVLTAALMVAATVVYAGQAASGTTAAVAATDVASPLVALDWPSTGAEQYQVALAKGSSFAAAQSYLSSRSNTTIELPASGKWYWKVRQTRPSIGSWSAPSSIRLGDDTIVRPPAPKGLRPDAGSTLHSADLDLHWRASSGARVEVRLSTHQQMSNPYVRTLSGDSLSLRLDRGQWWWQVRSAQSTVHAAGEWSTPRKVTVDPPLDKRAPGRPGGVSINRRTDDGDAVISWRQSADDRPGIQYWVFLDGNRVMSTRDNRAVRVPIPCGHAWNLSVQAVDASGQTSEKSPSASLGGPQCLDHQPPTTPDDIRVPHFGEDSAMLRWDASQDNRGIAGYVVNRNGVAVGGTTKTVFSLSHLRAATTYGVDVLARDSSGNVSIDPAHVDLTTATPAQSTGEVRAFVLATDGASIADAQAHYMDLDWIYPTYYSLSATSLDGLDGRDQPYVTDWFESRGVKVLPRIYGNDLVMMEDLFSTPEKREAFATMVADHAVSEGWDGVQLDFEPSVPKIGVDGLTIDQRMARFAGYLSDLTARLDAHMHPAGLLVSVAVPANWCQLGPRDSTTLEPVYCSDPNHSSVTGRVRPKMYDYPTLLNEADELWVMAWGLHWSTSEPGASADVRWVSAVADWVDSLVAGDSSLAAKVTIGRSLYSQDWHYQLARVDVLSTPALLPGGAAVPMCDNGTRARPRPLPVQPGDTTVTLQWICTIGFAELREYQPARKVLKDLGVIPTYDEATSESYAVLPTDVPGEHREQLWFSDYRSIEQFAPIATDRGWHIGLWRLGLEDQRVWTSLDGSG